VDSADKDSKQILKTALALLARREHSAKELNQKLSAKDYNQEKIEKILVDLTQQNLLSDERFAEVYVRFRKEKGFGPLKIQQELHERGVSAQIIDQYANSQDLYWYENIVQVHHKRFGDEKPDDFQSRVKQTRFLQNRGFSEDHINVIFVSKVEPECCE
jgi:regulatory protein